MGVPAMRCRIPSGNQLPCARTPLGAQKTRNLAILCACMFFILGWTSRGHAGSEKKFIKESCAEFTSRVLAEPESKAGETLGDSWVSWNGTILSMDQTLWGAEVRVSCSENSKDGASVILSLDAQPPAAWGLTAGKKVKFTGHLSGPFERGQITIKDVEFIQEQVKKPAPPSIAPPLEGPTTRREESEPAIARPPSSTANIGSAAQQSITETIRSYYQAVQDRQIDRAVLLYAAFKRRTVKRNVLEAIARDTQYYAIERIQIRELEPTMAKVTVELRHKKIQKPEEYWEVWMELVSDQGDWRILATPGRRVR